MSDLVEGPLTLTHIRHSRNLSAVPASYLQRIGRLYVVVMEVARGCRAGDTHLQAKPTVVLLWCRRLACCFKSAGGTPAPQSCNRHRDPLCSLTLKSISVDFAWRIDYSLPLTPV